MSKELLTPDVITEILKNDGLSLFYVPVEKHTFDMIMTAVKNNGLALKYADKGKVSFDIIYEAVKNDGLALEYVPKLKQGPIYCEIAVRNNGLALKYVAKKLFTKELCLLAVENNGAALEYVPEEFLCHDIYERAARTSGIMLKYLPAKYKTSELYVELIKNDGMNIEYIPKNRLTRQMCYDAVYQNGSALRFVPERFKDSDLCLEAVNQKWSNVAFVPASLLTHEIIEMAILQDFHSLIKMPEEIKTPDFYLKAFQLNTRTLMYIPEELCTKEMCLRALENDIKIASFIPLRFRKEPDILKYERKYGCSHIAKMYYDKNEFVVIERLPKSFRCDANNESTNCDVVETRFITFDEFYQYIDGQLEGVDLRGYQFDNIDLKKYKIKNCIIDNEILRKQNIYDDSFYAENVRAYASNSELCLVENDARNEISVRLDEYENYDIDDTLIYYISDLHLDHKILKRFPEYGTREEIVAFIIDIVDRLVSLAERRGMLLIAGDVSYQYEICKIFYTELAKKWNPQDIVVVLGNHELWNGCTDGSTLNINVEDIVKQYRCMFNEIGINLLHNDMLIVRNKYIIVENTIIKENEIMNSSLSDLQKECVDASYIFFGGVGFSGYNTQFNAGHGIYRSAIRNLEEDIKQTKRFEHVYDKMKEALGKKQVIVLTHTDKESWSGSKYKKNWIYVYGHTHKNKYENDEDKTIYADNQVGYYRQSIDLKYFSLSNKYDIFRFYEDGKYVISREAYMEFIRGQRIDMTFSDNSGIIHMLKRSGVYCFLYEKQNKLYILDGGAKRTLNHDINYYYDNLPEYVQCINNMIGKYNSALKAIANQIRRIGGSGKIHGAIVDIDSLNHVYLNPYDGNVTPYFATSMVDKIVFPNIQGLLSAKRKDLYHNYMLEAQKNKKILSVETNTLREGIRYVSETYMYEASQIIKKLQYTNFCNIVRVWNDDVLSIKEQIEDTN